LNFIQFSVIYIGKTNSEIEKTWNSSGPLIWRKASACRLARVSGTARACALVGHCAQRAGGGAVDAGGSGDEV
jgi:hypothetical protein